MTRPFVLPALLALLGLGCTDLAEFRTDEDRVYRGDVVGTDDSSCVPGDPCSRIPSFVRRGFPEGTLIEMTFDPEAPDGRAGTLTTLGERCTDTGDTAGCACVRAPSLEGATLLTIPPLVHDQLGLYDFPGGGRIRNYIFALDVPTGPLSGRDPMAFVSLIRGGRTEVRVVVGSGQRDCAPDDCDAFARGDCDYFGVFHLEKETVGP